MKDNIPMSNSNESQRVSILTNLEKIKFKFKKFLVLNQTKKLKKRKEKVKKDRGTWIQTSKEKVSLKSSNWFN